MIAGEIIFKNINQKENLFINNDDFNSEINYSLICDHNNKCINNDLKNKRFVFEPKEIEIIIKYFKLLNKIFNNIINIKQENTFDNKLNNTLDNKLDKDEYINNQIKEGKIINNGGNSLIYEINLYNKKYCIKISKTNKVNNNSDNLDDNFLKSLDKYYKEGILFNIYELGDGNLNDLKLLLKNKNININKKYDYIIKLFDLFKSLESLDNKLLFGDIKPENIIYFINNDDIIYKFIDYDDVIISDDKINEQVIAYTPYIYNLIFGIIDDNKIIKSKINIKKIKKIKKIKNYDILSLFVSIFIIIFDDKDYLLRIRDEDINNKLLFNIKNNRKEKFKEKIKNLYNMNNKEIEKICDNIIKYYNIYINNYYKYYINKI